MEVESPGYTPRPSRGLRVPKELVTPFGRSGRPCPRWRAVPRPGTLDGPAVHRRPVQVRRTSSWVAGWCRSGNRVLGIRVFRRHEGKGGAFGSPYWGIVFSSSKERRFTLAGVPVLNRRRESPRLPGFLKAGWRSEGRWALVEGSFADDDPAFEINPGGEDHGAGQIDRPGGGEHAGDPAVLHQNHAFALAEKEVLRPFQGALHALVVPPFVHLGAQAVDRRALPVFSSLSWMKVSSAALPISPPSVDLAHEVALAGAADGRIARHQRDGIQIHGQAGWSAPSSPGQGPPRAARVARADDHGVKTAGVESLHICVLSEKANLIGRQGNRARQKRLIRGYSCALSRLKVRAFSARNAGGCRRNGVAASAASKADVRKAGRKTGFGLPWPP